MENNKTEKNDKNIPNQPRKILVMVVIFILVLLASSYYAFVLHKQNQQITGDTKSVYGSGDYSKILDQAFKLFIEKSDAAFYYSRQIDNSNILKADSFTSRDSIAQINRMLMGSLSELDMYDETMVKAISDAQEIIQNSSLSEIEKSEVLLGFNKVTQDKKSSDLAHDRVVAMKNLYKNFLTLYEFMLANFDDYKVQTNPSGNFQVAFYSDANIAQYSQIYSDFQKLEEIYYNANKEFTDYKNQNFSQYFGK